ncbi:redoxin domain-containing protein [Dactylosporangium vinaceum]|uniref:TlpA family protein disulfide reductase n=1 Tax=Dactylosporangium vinaceum TaxID=53362 RepID=A0ABV5M8Z4_9ACTN|nr:redoxin family protein [Dactylosporangium vinaceum]UAB99495.1 redoxin domain-containing protein [Dactylosporangium vinaceum]
MRIRPVVAVLLAALVLLPAGCGGSGAATAPKFDAKAAAASDGPVVPAATSTAPTAPAVVPDALKFTGTTLEGQPFDAAKYAGRPVVLWFWAPWCAVCLGQASTVGDLAKQYDGKVTMVGVAGLDKNTKAMHEFIAEGEVGNVTHLNDSAGAIWRKFGVTQQSFFVMIDRKGKIQLNGYQDTVTLGQWVAYLDQH